MDIKRKTKVRFADGTGTVFEVLPETQEVVVILDNPPPYGCLAKLPVAAVEVINE